MTYTLKQFVSQQQYIHTKIYVYHPEKTKQNKPNPKLKHTKPNNHNQGLAGDH